jgi:hypothetical protein
MMSLAQINAPNSVSTNRKTCTFLIGHQELRNVAGVLAERFECA